MNITQNSLVPLQQDIALTAMVPMEMATAQVQLIAWCQQKLAGLRTEEEELKEAYEMAKRRGWKYTTLQNIYQRQVKKITFYDKMLAALEHGFYIVPNFPVQFFAIRTKAKRPVGRPSKRWTEFQQESQVLPQGTGDYKNPFPSTYRQNITEQGTNGPVNQEYIYPAEWDELEFPLTMAKPIIMDIVDKAMALKIFDQIGIMPATRNEDPVIIGQIKLKTGYNTKLVSFMLAWHLNTNVL